MILSKELFTYALSIVLLLNVKGVDSKSSRALRNKGGRDKLLLENIGFATEITLRQTPSFDQSNVLDFVFDKTSCPIVTPDGQNYMVGLGREAIGDVWPYSGPVFVGAFDEPAGYLNEVCTRTSDLEFWLCQGTITDLYGGTGSINYLGTYNYKNFNGEYAIIGGTGDFIFSVGKIKDTQDPSTGLITREIIF